MLHYHCPLSINRCTVARSFTLFHSFHPRVLMLMAAVSVRHRPVPLSCCFIPPVSHISSIHINNIKR